MVDPELKDTRGYPPLTDDEIVELEDLHYSDAREVACEGCGSSWPCGTERLIAERNQLRAELLSVRSQLDVVRTERNEFFAMVFDLVQRVAPNSPTAVQGA